MSSTLTQDKPTRVMIVEDHPLLIHGLQRLIEEVDEMVVIGQVTDGEMAVRLAEELQPDIVLMDVNLPVRNGIQTTREIKNSPNGDEISIIVLTAYDDDEQLYYAVQAGASAYYPKDVHPDELIETIRAASQGLYVIRGRTMTKAEAFRWLVDQSQSMGNFGELPAEKFAPLSPREMEILGYITRGASNKEIAFALDISQQTVKNHMSSILRKLNVDDRTQAAVLALRRGWIRLQDTERWSPVQAEKG